MPRSFSLPPLKNGHNVNSLVAPRKRSKPKENAGEYIKKSMKIIEEGCYENGKLKIDGSIGDYNMSIFRFKDRKRRINDISTAFTKSMVEDLKQLNPHLSHELDKLIQVPKEKYLKKTQEEKQEQKQAPFKRPIYKYEEEDHLLHPYVSEYQRQKWFSHSIEPPTNSEHATLSPLGKKSPRRLQNQLKKQKKSHIFQYMQQKRGNKSGLL